MNRMQQPMCQWEKRQLKKKKHMVTKKKWNMMKIPTRNPNKMLANHSLKRCVHIQDLPVCSWKTLLLYIKVTMVILERNISGIFMQKKGYTIIS